MKLAEISIKRPSIIIVLFTLLTLGGLLSYSFMGYELVPKFEINVVTISTVYPGASPSEVENSVTKKIEDAVGALENVKKVEATSYESLSVVAVQLNEGVDINYSMNDAQRKVNAILSDLPDDAEAPSLNKFSLSDLPIITTSVIARLWAFNWANSAGNSKFKLRFPNRKYTNQRIKFYNSFIWKIPKY